jgi:hypothetical protein
MKTNSHKLFADCHRRMEIKVGRKEGGREERKGIL